MANCLEVKENGVQSYNIVISSSMEDFAEAFSPLGYEQHRVCIVTDSNVAPLHLETVKKYLAPLCRVVETFVFPAGEENKTLDTVKALYSFLIERHFDRKDCLVALGGGVVGDLTGYAAATYLRGIAFVQMPTSLLAMTDSSIGGKTGVDFDAYKNMVGAFKMPRLVYMNLLFLDTLPDEQYFNGMAEVIKSGLIRDLDFYVFLLENMSEILSRDPAILEQMIAVCCKIKRAVVEEDPTEKGIRALLNFGHTIGHSIEKLMDFQLLHGQCVALGIVCAAYLSYRRGMITREEYLEIRDVLVAFRLPVTLNADLSADDILETARSDKKMDSGRIRFILLNAVGDAYIEREISDNELKEAILGTILCRADEEALTGSQIVRMSDILLGEADNGGKEAGEETADEK